MCVHMCASRLSLHDINLYWAPSGVLAKRRISSTGTLFQPPLHPPDTCEDMYY